MRVGYDYNVCSDLNGTLVYAWLDLNTAIFHFLILYQFYVGAGFTACLITGVHLLQVYSHVHVVLVFIPYKVCI